MRKTTTTTTAITMQAAATMMACCVEAFATATPLSSLKMTRHGLYLQCQRSRRFETLLRSVENSTRPPERLLCGSRVLVR